MDKQIGILIADSQRIFRESLRVLLASNPKFGLIIEAKNGRETICQAKEHKPDIVLLDISLPLLNGVEATRQIKRDVPTCKVIALSAIEDEDVIRRALAAGAMGYLTKETSAEDLIKSILTVYSGEMVLSPAVTQLVLEDYLRWADLEKYHTNTLTCREGEVLQLIAEGHNMKSIAGILNISPKTVRSHRSNLMQKLGLHNRGELIKYAIQKKIIEI